jgi:hypothetical protein
MNFLDRQFGRLGNRMFQTAFFYSWAKDNGTDFYFQDEKWFKKYEKDIRKMFGGGIGYDDRVAIHVRRGDYVNNPFYVDLIKTDYYKKAVAMFPNDRFLFFSDDIQFVKDYYIDIFREKNGRFDYSEGHTEEEDLKLMASCKHQIIANSSFSWWAAWLGKKDNQKVIYPLNWYADGVQRTKCPSDWIGI